MTEGYAVPEALVTTDWVLSNLEQPGIRVAEVDYDPSAAYELGHVPGAVLIDWKRDINDPVKRDILSVEAFEALMGRLGIAPETTVVLYGDFRNWFAAFAFWVFKLYGHRDVRLMDGGRRKWIDEGKPLTEAVPQISPVSYRARGEDLTLRAFLPTVLHALDHKDVALVDVRSPAEYKGEILAPPEYPNEGAQRGGHIPRAVNIPWAQAVRDDDTFKPAHELRALYETHGITPEKTVITYCRIGERSSHTWFVLKYLLGYPVVLNYDGSWSEWGNAVGLPIER